MNTNCIEFWVKVIGVFGTLGAVIFAVYQYYKGQKWQKASILLSLIDQFEKDNKIRIAREMLDWDKRKINIEAKKNIDFENVKLIKALEVVDWDDDRFNEEERIIRDVFDAFFDFFHKPYSFYISGLLKVKDLTYFYYYFELIHNIQTYKGEEFTAVFNNYIDSYRFIGLRTLLNEYKHNMQTINILQYKTEKDDNK